MLICIAVDNKQGGKNTETIWDLMRERFAFFTKFFCQ
jgi:hypothetical protein